MGRHDAVDLAQRKANDWGKPFRVLRLIDAKAIGHTYTVEQSGDYDRPPSGYVVVDVFKPSK